MKIITEFKGQYRFLSNFSHKDRQAEWTTHGYLSEQAARTSGEHAYGDDYVVWRITMTAELVVEGQPC